MARRCECVRINDDDSPQEHNAALLARVRFEAKPALALLSGAGDVLHVQYARLYPAYHINAVEMSDWSERLLTSREVIELVETTEEKWRSQEARLRVLEERKDATSAYERALIMRERGWPERARHLLELALERGASLEAREALASLHEAEGRPEYARDQYAQLIEAQPDHERQPTWRFEEARLIARSAAVTSAVGSRESQLLQDALATLRAFASNESSAEAKERSLRSHLELAQRANAVDDDAGLRRHLAWLRMRVGTGRTAPPVWSAKMLKTLLELQAGIGPEGHESARTLVWQLVRTHPDSVETQNAKHGLLGSLTLQLDPR